MSPSDLGNGSLASQSTYPVIAGVDGSFSAIRAARWAAAVAEKFEAPLQIVHAKPEIGHNLSDAIAGLRASEMAAQYESAEAILASAEHAVRGDFKDLRITTAQVASPADEALVDLSRNARMIVLGSDKVSLGTAILVGSTTTAVAAHSICPVVAWRGDTTSPTTQPVVLGIDHDDDSRVAITAAFEFAHRLGLGVIAVHTWSKRRPAGDVTLPFMIDWDQFENDERQHLSDSLAPWINTYPGVEVTQVVDPDKPSRALLRRAKDAQLIVVGSRGRGLLAGALLGSTGLNLLHHSLIPVMICHATDADD
jgi:nucleotide-binding universal stress UspA family protein